jgi:hypothetical protein
MVVVAVPAAASNLNWRHLSLMNGWQSSESIYGTGDPSWARHNGIVYWPRSATRDQRRDE